MALSLSRLCLGETQIQFNGNELLHQAPASIRFIFKRADNGSSWFLRKMLSGGLNLKKMKIRTYSCFRWLGIFERCLLSVFLISFAFAKRCTKPAGRTLPVYIDVHWLHWLKKEPKYLRCIKEVLWTAVLWTAAREECSAIYAALVVCTENGPSKGSCRRIGAICLRNLPGCL